MILHLDEVIFGKKGRYLAIGLLLILILASLVTLKGIYRKIVMLPAVVPQSPVPFSPSAIKTKDDIELVMSAHLFGEYLALQSDQKLPKTLLNIKLVGVLLGVPPQYSQVIIRLPNGSEKIFGINDTIPGGAKIVNIMQNYIVIERNDKKESLSLPQDTLIFKNMPSGLDFDHEKN